MDHIGRYQITGELGRGGFGVVYRARDPGLDRTVAIKVMGDALAGDPTMVERFRREARAAAALAHRNVVAVFECGEHEGRPFMAMEYLASGASLQELMERGRPLPFARRVGILRQAAEGLDFAHRQGFVHRDVKPANLWVLEDGTVKILDFGVARSAGSELTRSGQVLGTVAYMSPEQVRGQKVDARSDVFSLGVVAFELLGGRRPYRGTPSEVVDAILRGPRPHLALREAPWLEAVVSRCLEKDPAARWTTAAELAQALGDGATAPTPVVDAVDASATGTFMEAGSATGPVAPPTAPPQAAAPRFTPGAMLGSRYRIVGPLGRGGMGEVYRADDLRLGHPVALKLLPRAVAGDPARLQRLFAEVRVGREVTHPNVCRLHDVEEAGGLHFLTMEYVDGEDLASLLRRIGRPSLDKSLQIARELCAGLAAAHDKGVIHRDLKPANVMLDGRGTVRITDFGLAVAGEVSGPDAQAGTPAYMAPEQLAGGEVTPRTDVYALGLVLYELVTGQRRFAGQTLAEILAERSDHRPPSFPASREVSPELEQAVLRCLQEEPAARPSNARAVLALLPGADVLQAALLAGQTPSPDLVAAAGSSGALRPGPAAAALGVVWAGLAATLVMGGPQTMAARAPGLKSPEVMADRSRALLASLGHGEAVGQVAFFQSWNFNLELMCREVADTTMSGEGLVPQGWALRASYANPPASYPGPNGAGVRDVVFDRQGRLVQYRAPLPPQPPRPAGADLPATDWSKLFAEARLEPDRFNRVPAPGVDVAADEVTAWTGSSTEEPGQEIQVLGASRGGRPVWFAIPHRSLRRGDALDEGGGRGMGILMPGFMAFLLFVFTPATAWLARRNVRAGRADLRGAATVSLATFAATFAARLLMAHYAGDVMALVVFVFNALWRSAAMSLAEAALLGLAYLAVEPLLRRSAPQALIAWNRVLAGQWRDPMVGRDLLLGAAAGTAANVLSLLGGGFSRLDLDPLALEGPRFLAAAILIAAFGAATITAAYQLLLTSAAILLKRPAAIAAGVVVLALLVSSGGDYRFDASWTQQAVMLAIALLVAGVLVRVGVVATFAFFLLRAWVLLLLLPAQGWYLGSALVTPALLALGALWACRTALAGQRLLGSELQEPAPALH